ncbi:MAG: TlpA disulfide reductase family protein [bacterium]|nr:TlpA disulfide reductase family protein [bacterium]
MSPSLPRLLWRIGALAAFAAALWIVIGAGLPDRAAYTGAITEAGLFTAPEVGALAPLFETTTHDGSPFTLIMTRGAPVVLNFWATWCAPCVYEMPELQALHQAWPGVQVYGINLGESPAQIESWMQSGGYTFPALLDTSGEIARLYALRGQPTTVILSPGGVVLAVLFGATTQTALERILTPFLD